MTHQPLVFSDSLPSLRPAAKWRLPTGAVLVLVLLGAVGLSWAFGQFVMTRDVYGGLVGSGADPALIDGQWGLIRRYVMWGYAFQVPIVFFKLVLTALTLQMIALVTGEENRFRVAFRASVLGAGVLSLGTAFRIAWLLGVIGIQNVNAAWLSVSPLSVASVFIDASAKPSLVYTVLSAVSLPEMGWIAVASWVLITDGKLSRGRAYLCTVGCWALVLLLQSSVAALVSGIGS